MLYLSNTENCGHQCLAYIYAVLCLLEIVRIRRAVYIDSNLVDSWQWMQYLHVAFAAFEHRSCKDATVFYSLVFQRVGESLALHTGHVYDVCCLNDVVYIGVLVIFKPCVFNRSFNR